MYNLLALQMAAARMLWDAQIVIALRMMKMASILPADRREMIRMGMEKGPAFFDAALAAQRATLQGKDSTQIMRAAMHPIARKAKANRRRLTR